MIKFEIITVRISTLGVLYVYTFVRHIYIGERWKTSLHHIRLITTWMCSIFSQELWPDLSH